MEQTEKTGIPTNETPPRKEAGKEIQLSEQRVRIYDCLTQLQIVGTGGGGLKVQDLEEHRDTLRGAKLEIQGGTTIANSYFNEFCLHNGIVQDYPLHHQRKTPDSLCSLNEQILERYRGAVLALRSSAFGERGGTGIYDTRFFAPTGDHESDLRMLGELEGLVYASAFSQKAKAYRAKHPTEHGMGMLVQPVVGQQFGDHYMPIMSGSAYTSLHGKMTIRIVPGLGTMAVDDSAPVLTQLPDEETFIGMLSAVDEVDGINLTNGRVERIPTPPDLKAHLSHQSVLHLWDAMHRLTTSSRDYYLEWATACSNDHQKPKVLQIAPYLDTPSESVDLSCEQGVQIAEGHDIVNHGRKLCVKIIIVRLGDWNEEVKKRLFEFNLDNRNYLLIVPQEASSSFKREMRIDFDQLSNASAVLEDVRKITTPGWEQYMAGKGLTSADHTGGRAGQHFQQVCDREDILFLGATVDWNSFPDLEPDEVYPEKVEVYNCEALVVNDSSRMTGRVYVLPEQKVAEPDYRPSETGSISYGLRIIANSLCDASGDLADHFYNVHRSIPFHSEDDSGVFDPYQPDPDTIDEIGIEGLLEAIEAVLTDGKQYLSPQAEAYLLKFRDSLLKSNSNDEEREKELKSS
ncbi:MAG: PEP/pyruvate-binding domain-containing protein [Candidatus Peribacter sp.]|jgi:hypothetical protein